MGSHSLSPHLKKPVLMPPPGVVETEMQDLIRAKGQDAMDADSYSRFTTLKKEGKLLPPELPGTAIAKLALAATKDFSGQFVNWDDDRIGSLTGV